MRPVRLLALVLLAALAAAAEQQDTAKPNIVLIYADDIGYGDFSCYGATRVRTPAVDRLAQEGLRFTDAHAAAATCTPSRYALLTGEYAWRHPGTGILPGDARLIIAPGRATLPALLRAAGYATGCVGKWHLGLGQDRIDWNADIAPGPLEVGFDESFIIPATVDRVPCVYVAGHRVLDLDPADPLRVSYDGPLDDAPTGRSHPELLKVRPSHGHDNTIVNGISRIGFMSGGKAACWVDDDIAPVLTARATGFIERHRDQPFFLYFATHDIHVPRSPAHGFAGSSGCGVRGDVIQQFDGCAAEIIATLERLHLAERTLVILSSDNGPVVDDGYADGAVADLNGHRPAGPLRGGKYSSYEGGTRVPLIVRWPGRVKPGVSDALIGQVDLLASLAALAGRGLPGDGGPDSLDLLPALLGESRAGREELVEEGDGLAIRRGAWKFRQGKSRKDRAQDGAAPAGELFDLAQDLGETTDVSAAHPDIATALAARLHELRQAGRSRP